MIGRKIYYELSTGNVVLVTEEKHGINAVNTTKEQDFQLYSPLQVRNPDTIGVIQLEYGQNAAEFQSARSVHVNPETKELQFEYPEYHPPLTAQVETLKAENQMLKTENEELKQKVGQTEQAILELSILMGGMV